MQYASLSSPWRIPGIITDVLSLVPRRIMSVLVIAIMLSSIVSTSTLLYAQKAIRPKEAPRGQIQNFYQMQKEWDSYFEALKKEKLEADPNNPNPLKGTGWKQYKRWEWYWQSRVNPDGSFANPDIYTEELQKVQNQKKPSGIQATANWTAWGPTKAAGGYWGVGRTNAVVVTNSTIFAATAGGGLWRSTDNGTNWTNPTASIPGLGTSDIAFANSATLGTQVMYLATGDYLGGSPSGVPSIGVWKSTDGGSTWTATGLTFTRSQQVRIARILCDPNNPNTVIAASNLGIHRSTDGGANWTTASLGTALGGGERFMDMEMQFGDPSVMVASTDWGRIYRSTNGGANWTAITANLPDPIAPTSGRVALAVSQSAPNTMYAIQTNGSNRGFLALYKSTDAGASWTTVTVASPTNMFAYSNEGTDAGGQGEYDLCLQVSSTNANVVYFGGVNLWRTADGGANWTCIGHWAASAQTGAGGVPEVHADQHYLFMPTGSETIWVGNDGGIYSSSNFGASWTWHVNGTTGINMMQLYRVSTAQTDANRLLVGAQDNSTTLLNSADVIERTRATGDGMGQLIDRTNVQNMLTSGTNGSLQRSLNQGQNWSSYFPAGSRNNEAGAWVTPYLQSSTNANTLFFGYVNVWRTDNAWAVTPTFTQVSTGFAGSLQVLAVGPDGLSIYASTGASNAVIRYSPDGGATWLSRTPPTNQFLTRIAVHPNVPNIIWASFGGYAAGQKVYRSNDGGATWINVSGTLPNVPVNVVFTQRNSPERVYAGTDLGVYYRDASTSDWIKYNDGAMSNDNIVVTDIDIQYAQQQIRVGTYSRGAMSGALVTDVANTTITVSPTTYNFGVVNIGQSSTQTIAVTFAGLTLGETVTFTTTGNVFATTQTAFVANQSSTATTLTISFSPVVNGPANGTLVIRAGSVSQTITLTGSGPTNVVVATTLTVSPTTLSFGVTTANALQPTSQTVLVTINNMQAGDFLSLSLPNNANGQYQFPPNQPTIIGTSANASVWSTAVTVGLVPGAGVGAVNGSLQISTSSPTMTVAFATVNLQGNIVSGPATTLSISIPGNQLTNPFFIQAEGATASSGAELLLNVQNATASPQNPVLLTIVCPPHLRATPVGQGAYTDVLTIQVTEANISNRVIAAVALFPMGRVAGASAGTITATLLGTSANFTVVSTVTRPTISVNTPIVNFGSIPFGGSSNATFGVTVSGFYTGAVASITTGTQGLTFAPTTATANVNLLTSATVNVNATWSVPLNATPGITQATITLQSDTQTNLTATSTTITALVNILPPPATTLTVSPTTLSFGSLVVNSPASTQTVRLIVANMRIDDIIQLSLPNNANGQYAFGASQSVAFGTSGNITPIWSTTITVQVTPGNQPGPANGSLQVATLSPTMTVTFATVALNANIQPLPFILTANPTSLSFGSVTAGTVLTTSQTVALSGTNFQPNQIINLSTTRAGVTFSSIAVQADMNGVLQSTNITVTWNVPNNLNVGLVSSFINFGGTTSVVSISVDIIPAPATGVLTLSATTANFGNAVSGLAFSSTQTVNISGVGFLANQNVAIQTTVAGLTANPQNLTADGAGVIANTPVTFTWNVPPNLPIGTTNGIVTLLGTTSSISVSVNIVLPPLGVTFNPPQVQFGNVTQNTTATSVVQISGVGYTPNSAVNFTTTMAGVTLTPTTTNANASGQFGPMNLGVTLNGAVQTLGTTNGSIAISGTTANILIQANIGAPPVLAALTLNPTSLNFGSVTVGTITTQTFSVSGVGFAANQMITINGVPGLAFNPSTIQASATGAITPVNVTATWTVAQNAPVGITTGAITFTNTNASIAITVRITAPPTQATVGVLTVTPLQISFGTITAANVQQTSTQTISVSGVGFPANQALAIASNIPGLTFNPISVIANANGVISSTNVVVTLTLQANPPIGATAGNITFTGTNSTVGVGINVIAPPPLQFPLLTATPGGLNFGAVTIGAASSQTVTLSGTGFAANQTLNLSSNLPGIALAPSTTTANAQGVVGPFSVVATWTAPGVASNSSTSGSITITGTTTTISLVGLIVVPPPQAPTLSAVTNLSSNSFVVNWSAVAGATSYSVDVATDAAFTNTIIANASSGTNLFFNVQGLTPNTNYSYRVRATNNGGSTLSAVASVLTLPTVPASLPATTVSATSFVANWSTPAGGAASYELDVNTAQGFNGIAILSSTNTVNTNFTVTGLTAGTTYFWRVRAVNASGRSENSTPLTVTTIVPVGAPIATSAANITSNSFVANWIQVTGATGYVVDVATDAGFTVLVPNFGNVSVPTPTVFLNVTGLTGNTQYFYRVRALGTNNQVATSNAVSVTTIPGQVTSVNVINPTATGFTVVWTPPLGGAPTYTVEVLRPLTVLASKTRDEIEQVNLVLVTSATVQGTSATFTGLAPGVQYSVRVRAGNASGTTDGSGSGTVGGVTTLNPPPAPLNLVRTFVSATTLTIAWIPPANATPDISYRIAVSVLNGLPQILTSQTTSITISGLVPNTLYNIEVRSVNSAGTSANALVGAFTTAPLAPIALQPFSVAELGFVAQWDNPAVQLGVTYVVEVSVSQTFDQIVQSLSVTGTPDASAANRFSQQVLNLQPSTQYFYRVRASNQTSVSAPSNVIPVRTRDITYSIAGVVRIGGALQANVTINVVPGAFPNANGIPVGIVTSATTDQAGAFVISRVTAGTYTLIPLFAGINFTPQTRVVTIATTSVAGQDFIGEVPRFAVSGRVRRLNGEGLAGISVSVAPAQPNVQPVVTDTNGNYSFVLPNGNYTLSVATQIQNLVISPLSAQVTVNNAPVVVPDFTASTATFSLSGRVATGPGAGVAGVAIQIVRGTTATTAPIRSLITGQDGTYSTILEADVYTVFAVSTAPNVSFAPPSVFVQLNANTSNINFTATVPSTVSGRVVDQNGNGLAGIQINTQPAVLVNGQPIRTDASGAFSFNVPDGQYLLTPISTNANSQFRFDPPLRQIIVSGASVVVPNFIALPAVYSITGRVTVRGNGAPSTIVTLVADGANAVSARTTVTGSTGTYQFVDVTAGNYTLGVQAFGVVFAQNPIRVSITNANVTNVNFEGQPQTAQVSGTILGSNGLPLTPAPVVSARLLVAGSVAISTTANANGQYVFNLEQGLYRIAPQPIPGSIFSPASSEVSVTGANIVGINFTSSIATYSIAGRTVLNNTPLSGVAVSISSVTNATVTLGTLTSLSDGSFVFGNLPAGSYTLTARAQGFTFTPVSTNATLSTSNIAGIIFNAAIVPVAVSGRITDQSGAPLAGVNITVSPNFSNAPIVSGQDGQFTTNLLGGQTYTFVANRAGFTFTPPVQSVSVASVAVNNVNFTGIAASYSIVGRINTVSPNIGLGGIVVNLSGAGGFVRSTTASNGSYVFNNIPVGTYTLSPGETGVAAVLNFTPAQRSVVVSSANVQVESFSADLRRFAVSGSITGQSGPVAGVAIAYTPIVPGTPAVVTGDDGTYSLSLPNGTYVIRPAAVGLVLAPTSSTVTVSGANVPGINFTTSTPTFVLSGRVTTPAGIGVANVRVLIANANSQTPLVDITDNNGNYSTRLVAGTYQISIATEANPTAFYTPNSITQVVSSDVNTANFTARPLMTVSGRVTENSTGVADVIVTMSNNAVAAFSRTARTDATGGFTLSNLLPGVYSMQANRLNTIMDPSQLIVSLETADVNTANFAATTIQNQTFTVSGVVRDDARNPIAGAQITIRNSATVLTVQSNANGAYQFENVPRGFYNIQAGREGFVFANNVSRQVFVSQNLSGSSLEFVGSVVPTRLDVPTLNSPSAGAIDVANPVGFSFNPVAQASQYDIRIARDQAMANVVFSLTTDRTVASLFLVPSTYFWQVRARTGSLTSDWSVARSFDIAATPAPLTPTFGSVVTSPTINLTWSAIQGITNYQVRYTPSIANLNRASTATVNGTAFSINANTLNPSTTYYWQARAGDRDGRAWSFFSAFRTPAVATPPIAQLAFPANNGQVPNFAVTFRWGVPADQTTLVDRYTLQISDDPSFTSTRTVNRNVGRSTIRIETFNQQSFSRGRVFWRVIATNSLGVTTSETFSFQFPALISRTTITQQTDIPLQFAITQTDGDVGYVSIPTSAIRRILGRGLQEGDIVGTFYRRNDSLICGGYGLASQTEEIFIPTYSRIAQDSKDGFESGETLIFQVWDGQTRTMIPSPTVEYAAGSTQVFNVDSTITLRRIEVVATSVGRSLSGVDMKLGITPNPATEIVNVDWDSKAGETYTMSIMNAIGVEVARFTGRSMSDGERISWSADKVQNRTYMVRLVTPRGVNTAKVMVVK